MSEEDQVNSGYVDTAVDGLPEELGADNTAEERPEWLPQKFKTGEDLAKSYGELENSFRFFRNQIKIQLKKRLSN